MNQTLYLLRHAKAEPWSPGINDFGRSLNQKGHDHMLHLAAWMQANLSAPGAALCSPSLRTRETIAPFFSAWPQLQDKTAYVEEMYEASTGLLHSLAEQAFEDSESVFMVGHNPGFEYLATAVLREADEEKITKMATGTLAVIEFPHGYQDDSGQGVPRHRVELKNLVKHL